MSGAVDLRFRLAESSASASSARRLVRRGVVNSALAASVRCSVSTILSLRLRRICSCLSLLSAVRCMLVGTAGS